MSNHTAKHLLIVGASGMGREVYDLCKKMPHCGKEWEVRGFLDTRTDILKGLGDFPPILGSPFRHKVQPNERFICAVGDSGYRLQIGEFLRARGAKFVTVSHPDTHIGSNTQIGEGFVMYGWASIGPSVQVGHFVFLNALVTLGHDGVIGDGTTIGPQTCVGGWVRMGRGVYIGSNATILPHAVLEDFCYVGAGSVVLRRVKARTKVFGNPAVPIGTMDDVPAPK